VQQENAVPGVADDLGGTEEGGGMKDINYDFQERRQVEVRTYNGGAITESFNVSVEIYHLQHEQVEEVRNMIREYCRGKE